MSEPVKIRRRDAKKAGYRHYFTGEPCENGHVSIRLVSTFQCLECLKFYRARSRRNNPGLAAKQAREWRNRNIERARENSRRWHKNNPDRVKATQKRSKAKNIDKVRRTRRAYDLKNKEKIAQKTAEWRRINREAILAKNREKYQANAEKCRAASAAYRRANPEKHYAATQAWFKANPDYKRAVDSARKAKMRGANGTYSQEDVADLKRLQKNKCAYCRKRLSEKYHVDHIIALSKGGRNDRQNLQILCQPCNQRKHAKDPIAFAQELGRLL